MKGRPHNARPRLCATVLLAVLSVPLAWSLWGAGVAGLDGAAWRALLTDPQTRRALGLSLWTGLLASALSITVAAWLLSHHFPGPAWARLVRCLSPLLAVPHAAFAIGLAFWLAPSGWLLRALSPWATGMAESPLVHLVHRHRAFCHGHHRGRDAGRRRPALAYLGLRLAAMAAAGAGVGSGGVARETQTLLK